MLPNLEIKKIPIEITEDVQVYSLPIEDKESTRREARIQMSIPMAYRTPEGKWFSTKSLNLSSTGVCLIKEPNDIREEKVFVRLLVPIKEGPLECYANVRWSSEDSRSMPQMGLELLLPDKTRKSLSDWLTLTSNIREKDHNFLRK